MWTRVTGQPAFNNILFNRSLKLDGVNDYLGLPANIFYEPGSGAFTFVLKFLHLSSYAILNNTSRGLIRTSSVIASNRFIAIIGKTSTSTTDFLRVQFVTVNSDGTLNTDILSYNTSDFPLYQWNTMVIVRRGTNNAPSTDTANYPNSVRNPNNVEVWNNGVKLTRVELSMVSSDGLQWNVDNNDPLTIGSSVATNSYVDGYFDFFAYYNKALSQQEIIAASQGNFTDDLAKGIWNFNGNTTDDSSVGNSMTLYNSTTPSYITYPKTEGIFVFKPNVANQQYSKVFSYAVSIVAVYKTQAYGYEYSVDNGITWQSLASTAGSNTAVNIDLPADTIFLIRDTTARTTVGVVHLTF